eukprot:530510-Rhodomonas_salina.1
MTCHGTTASTSSTTAACHSLAVTQGASTRTASGSSFVRRFRVCFWKSVTQAEHGNFTVQFSSGEIGLGHPNRHSDARAYPVGIPTQVLGNAGTRYAGVHGGQ